MTTALTFWGTIRSHPRFVLRQTERANPRYLAFAFKQYSDGRFVSLPPDGPHLRRKNAPPLGDALKFLDQTLGRLEKRLQTGLRATKDQRMHIMRAFIGVHRLKVDHVTDHAKLQADAVTAMHVA